MAHAQNANRPHLINEVEKTNKFANSLLTVSKLNGFRTNYRLVFLNNVLNV